MADAKSRNIITGCHVIGRVTRDQHLDVTGDAMMYDIVELQASYVVGTISFPDKLVKTDNQDDQ